jgi:phosphonopyruvate decarboxylase
MAKTATKGAAKAAPKTKTVTPVSERKSSGRMDRRMATIRLLGKTDDVLIIGGIAGAKDDAMGAAGGDVAHCYALGGAMGAACAMGLGLALAQPNRRVFVVTGEGELLMNSGTLATIGVLNPPNLSIVVLDNEYYGETGYQPSHTARGVDLVKIAEGSGIKATRMVTQESELDDAARMLRQSNGTSFVVANVGPTDPQTVPHSRDGKMQRQRFVRAVAAWKK